MHSFLMFVLVSPSRHSWDLEAHWEGRLANLMMFPGEEALQWTGRWWRGVPRSSYALRTASMKRTRRSEVAHWTGQRCSCQLETLGYYLWILFLGGCFKQVASVWHQLLWFCKEFHGTQIYCLELKISKYTPRICAFSSAYGFKPSVLIFTTFWAHFCRFPDHQDSWVKKGERTMHHCHTSNFESVISVEERR